MGKQYEFPNGMDHPVGESSIRTKNLIDSESGLPEFGQNDAADSSAETVRNSGSGFSASAIWAQSKWWMVGVAALICIASVASVWVWSKPMYKASALVRVSPKALRIAFKNEENSSAAFYKTFVNTQVSIIRGQGVLQRVLDQPKVRQTSWYTASSKGLFWRKASHLERLTEAVSVKAYRESELIEVSVEALSPGVAAILVNAVVDEYKRMSDETLRQVDIKRFDALMDEHHRVQKEIEGLIETKFTIAKKLGTATPEELRSQLSTQLSRLEEELESTERNLRMIEGDLAYWSERDASRQEQSEPGEVGAAVRYGQDAEWRRLYQQSTDVEHHLELARQDFGEEHPRIKELTSGLVHVRRQIKDREMQIEQLGAAPGSGESAQTGVGGLQHQKQRLELQANLLREQIVRQRLRVGQASDLAGDLAHYDEQIQRKRELSETLHARLTELEVEGKAPARIAVEAHASEPVHPSTDRRVLMTVLFVFVGLVGGIGVGVLRGFLDPRIYEVADVQDSVRAPFLGQLPSLPTTKNIFAGCTPFLAESIRIVRTSLLERLEPSRSGVVLITSTTSRTGKTSFSALMARSLGALGRRTLLVEGDLRQPSLSERIELGSPLGLAAVLDGRAKPEDVIVRNEKWRFDVVFAGQRGSEFDPETLANGRLDAALSQWRRSYDIILIDSPPVLPVADSRILARSADGTMMILRSTHTRRADVIQAFADLHSAGGKLLGTVLVSARISGGYGGYGYDAGYYGARPNSRLLETVVGASS